MTEREKHSKTINDLRRLPKYSPIEERIDMFGEKIGVSREWYEKSIELRKVLERCFVDDEYLHARLREKERKETAKEILSVWKQMATSYDSGETQKKSFERIDRLAEWYGVEVEE